MQRSAKSVRMEITRPPRGKDGAAREYQRAYKACLSCRQRKAKCDLGTGLDGMPLGPPCARCRREQRQCVFSEKRAWERKKREGDAIEEHARHVRQRSSTYSRESPTSGVVREHVSDPQRGNEVTFWADSHHSVPRPDASDRRQNRQQSASSLANSMMRRVVSSGNDALNILFEAATAQEESGINTPDVRAGAGQSSAGYMPTGHDAANAGTKGDGVLGPYDPPIIVVRPVELSDVESEVLRVWESCRFVKMGWFNAREAVTLVDLFFRNMSVLSPILTDFYADHRNHHWLVTSDHVLCCTILMISSRYHVLPGVGGESRNFFIHHRLWQHCQQLVMRLTFGQDKCTKSTIRCIGSIEALLLMTEWHPRSLHFPPESDGWESELTSAIADSQGLRDSGDSTSASPWVEDMMDPAKRSDQMSWMLLGAALSLAYEIGVYEPEENDRSCPARYGAVFRDQMKIRRQRVQRLVYVYINQLAWRIGCMSLMPQSLSHTVVGAQPNKGFGGSSSEWLSFMDAWIDLTKLAKSVTDMFFPSVSFARQQLHTGRYISLLDHFRPLLDQWRDKHLQPHMLNKPFYNDLFIEYHFVRVYTHSVGMQAVVERILADAGPENVSDDVRPMNIEPIDYEFIQEVIDGCCQILNKVAQLGESGALRFSPVRIHLRITSSSIFLMKALSLGTRQAKLQEYLAVLEKTIQALRSNALDDIHLSSRYATLLNMHVSRLRRNLLASSKTKSSRNGTRGPSLAPQSRMPDGQPQTMADVSSPHDEMAADMDYTPTLNDMAADDWLSLPFDPSMAPFGISSGGQFPAYEGGALNFIWNLPS